MEDLKEKLLQELSDAVVDMDEDKAVEVANRFIENNFNAYEGIDKGLADGMKRQGSYMKRKNITFQSF